MFRALRQSFANARGIQVTFHHCVRITDLSVCMCVCVCMRVCLPAGLVISQCKEGVPGPQANGVDDSTGVASGAALPQDVSEGCRFHCMLDFYFMLLVHTASPAVVVTPLTLELSYTQCTCRFSGNGLAYSSNDWEGIMTACRIYCMSLGEMYCNNVGDFICIKLTTWHTLSLLR